MISSILPSRTVQQGGVSDSAEVDEDDFDSGVGLVEGFYLVYHPDHCHRRSRRLEL